MVILECYMDAFGMMKNKAISLRPGVNVITGANETGKTTIANFIKAMLFGMKEGEVDYAHYLPYEFTGAYGGRMKVLKNGLVYEIERDFLTGALSVKKAGEYVAIENPEEWLKAATAGFTKDDFVRSGYIAQNAFLDDAERYRESVEKDALRKKEEAIKDDYVAAKAILLKKRNSFSEKQDDAIGVALEEVETTLSKKAQELDELQITYPEEEADVLFERATLESDLAEIEQANKDKEELLKEGMLQEKMTLTQYTEINEKALKRSNLPGILLIVLGVILATGDYFYFSSNQISGTDDKRFWIFIAGLGVAAILIIVGILLCISIFRNRRFAEMELQERDEYTRRAELAEREYQRFINAEPGARTSLKNRESREESLRKKEEALRTKTEQMEALQKDTDALSAKQKELAKAYEEQNYVKTEMKAIDIALMTLDKLAGLGQDTDEGALSEAATDILHEMDPKRDSIISVENEVIFVVENGRRVLFSDLSTSSMQEVLFAVRLAALNRMDMMKELPLILDESLANLDADRLNSAMHLLRTCSRQSLLLSCQPRERKSVQ